MIRVHQTDQGYEAEAVIDTRYGPVIARASAPTGWVDEACARLLERRPELMASGADFLGDLKRTFADVAKSKAFGDVTSIVSQVASSPLAQVAASAIGSPAAGAALGSIGMAAAAANGLAAKARAGDPRAARDVRDVVVRAKAGDPKAQKAAKLLRESFAAQAAKDMTPGPQQGQFFLPSSQDMTPGPQQGQFFLPTMAQPSPAVQPFGYPQGVLVDWPAYRAAVDGRPYGAPA